MESRNHTFNYVNNINYAGIAPDSLDNLVELKMLDGTIVNI